MKPGLHLNSLASLPLFDALNLAKHAGFSRVEVSCASIFEEIRQHGRKAVVDRLRNAGIRLQAFGRLEKITFASLEDMEFHADQTHELCELARDTGAMFLVLTPGDLPEGVSEREVTTETRGVLRELGQIAMKYDIGLGLEFQGHAACSVRNLRQTLDIVYKTDRVNVGLVLDTYHFQLGASRLDSLQRLDPRVLYVFRCNDCAVEPAEQPDIKVFEKLLPGEGIAPLAGVLEYLREVDFSKYVGLELTAPAYAKWKPEELGKAAIGKLSELLRTYAAD